MKFIKKVMAVLLTVSMLLTSITFPTPVYAAASTDTYVKELIAYYKAYQEDAATDIERVLTELKAVDEKTGEAWEDIMDYWSKVNSDGFVNIDTVPTGIPNDDSVAIVILGFALNSDGTMKDELVGRLQTGLNIANQYTNSYVVVTGGGTAANNPSVTEGGLMGEWLLAQGLDADRLIVENRAPDTVGNAKYTYEILKQNYPQVENVVLVTSDYHVPRGCILYYSKFVLDALDQGKEPLTIISNAGYGTGTNGYETISLQANGVSSVAGVSGLPTVTLSKLVSITVKQNTMYTVGADLDLTVLANYDTGYVRDVTDLVTVTHFDKTLDNTQTIHVTYKENDVTISGDFTLSVKEKELVNKALLEELLNKAKALNESSYTKDSYEKLKTVMNNVEAALSTELTVEKLTKLYNELNNAINALRTRLNIIKYKNNVTTTASSVSDGGLSAITDGKTDTYATLGTDIKDVDVVIELDAYYNLEEIVVRPYHSSDSTDNTVRSYFYDLYVSTNGTDWSKVASHTTNGTKDAGNSHKFDTVVEAKYIKIDGTGKVNPGNQTNQAFHLSEVYAYGQESRDILLGKPYTSSGSDTSTSSSAGALDYKALDGDRSTYWDAGAYSSKPWIDVDLGELYKLDSVNVVTYQSSSRYYQFEVYTSIDGEYYTKVAEKKDEVKPTVAGTTLTFDEAVYATHIKVIGTYNSANSAFHIAELRAYGSPSDVSVSTILAKQNVQSIIESTFRSDYTAASWEKYKVVREEAIALLANESATEQQYLDMKDKLLAAKDKLVAGNPDEKAEGTFRVGSFNIWAPNPNHPNVEAILDELLRCEIDYAGIQELDKENNRDPRDVLKLIASNKYSYNYQKSIDYQNGQYGIGQLSSTAMIEKSGGNYAKVGSEETRSWQRMVVEVGGEKVAIYNTHMSLGTGAEFNSNVQELLDILENDPIPYKLVTGDFNATRENMDAFKEQYNLANGQNGLWYSTFEGDRYASGLGYIDGDPSADITSGIDNIIYTKNLEISNFRVVYNDGLSDHFMIYADFKISSYDVQLKQLVDSLNYKEEQYSEESWAAYEDALGKAKDLLANTNYEGLQDELKAAMQALEAAIKGLKPRNENEVRLMELVKEVEAMKLGFYTSASVSTLNYALANAKNVLASEDKLDKVLIDAYDALTLAVDNLVARVNIALNKTASASHNSANAYKVVDGSLSTYYAGEQNGNVPIEDTEIYIDLENVYALDVINVTPYYASNNRYYNFEVYVSEDNSLWSKVGEYTGTTYSTEAGYDFHLTTSTNARYIKIKGLKTYVEGREDINNFHVCEVRAYGELVPQDKELINIAQYGKVTVDSGSAGYRIADGVVTNSYWGSSNGIANAYAMIELPKVVEVEEVKVVTYYNNTSKWYTYEVLASVNGTDWTSIGSYNEEVNKGSAGYTFTLSTPVEAKYIKVKGLNTNNTNLHLVDVMVFAEDDNIALGKTVTTSHVRGSDDKYSGHNLVDGVMTTNAYWDTGDVVASVDAWATAEYNDLPYTIIDLESVYALDTINVMAYYKNDRYYKYDIYTSVDGVDYTLAAQKTDEGTGEYSVSFDVDVKARYIKVVGTYNSANKGFHLLEVRAYGEEYNYKNYALNGQVTVNNGSNGAHMTDGLKPSNSNYWASDNTADQSYAVIELTDYVKLESIVVIPYYRRTQYYYNYEILISKDNVNWTSVATYTDKSTGYTVAGQTFDLTSLDSTEARYVKIQGIESNNSNKIHIVEVEAYGYAVKEATADYSAVETAIAKVPADTSIYTVTSLVNLASAINAVDYTLPASKQSVVNAYAKAIEDAIEALELNPSQLGADYSKVEQAIAKVPADLTLYTTSSVNALQAVINSVDYTLKQDRQADVDAYAVAIENAIAALVSKNAALNKTVFESDHEGSNAAGKAVDGSTGTYWAGKTHDSWMIVDLGAAHTVESINLLAYSSGSRYYQYEILGSLDAETWTTLASKTDKVAEPSKGIFYDVEDGMYRYIKVQFIYNSANSAVHLKELTVYGEPVEIESSGVNAKDMQKLTYTDGNTSMPYRLHVPEDYDSSKEYPVIVFLHGAGERGNNNTSQLANAIQNLFDNHSALKDSIVIAPQCPADKRWVETDWTKGNYDSDAIEEVQLATVMKILESVQDTYSTDNNRIYAMGLSMGGYGAWNLLMNHSDVFAAGVTICGGADLDKADILADIPIWTFHGTIDPTVPFSATDTLVEAIRNEGKNKLHYSIYEGAKHNIWNMAVETYGLIDWLFAQELDDRDVVNQFDKNHYDNWNKALSYNGKKTEGANYTNLFATHAIEVQKGDTLNWGPFGKESYVMEVYDANYKLVRQVQFTDTTSTALGTQVAGVKNKLVDEYTYSYTIADDNAAYVRILGNMSTKDSFRVYKNENANVYISYENPLYNKSVLFVGDSITDGVKDDYNQEGWAGRIGENNDMDWINAGKSGASASTARPTNRVISQLQKYASEDFEYVILHGGVNDAMEAFPIGEVADTYNLADFDINTFAGGLEEMFYYAVKEYSGAKLGYIVNYATPNSNWGGETQDMSAYFEVAKEICDKWKIPYIDLYSGTITLDGVECSYSYDILKVDSDSSVFYGNDAKEVHIGGKGYDIIAPYIGYWMRSLTENTVSEIIIGENVAYKKEVTMSSIEGGYNDDGSLYYSYFDPQNATDGIIDTSAVNANRTSLGRVVNDYLEIDLEQVYDISQINVYYYPKSAGYKILVSTDQQNWVTVDEGSFTDTSTAAGVISVALDETVAGRYVRVQQTALLNNTYSMGFNEVEVFALNRDLTALKEAIALAESLDPAIYEDMSAVELQLEKAEAVLVFPETQELVDAVTKSLNDAIDALQLLPADYQAVNSAVERANQVDTSKYTVESLQALTDALNAVQYGLDITKQDIVDGYAKDIDDAIANLVVKVSETTTKVEDVPTVDPTQSVDKVEVGTNEEAKEVLNETAKELLEALKEGKDVTNVTEEFVEVILENLEAGNDIEVVVSILVELLEAQEVSAADMQAIVKAVSKVSKDAKVAQYFDLVVMMSAIIDGREEEVSSPVSKLTKPLTFTIAIPESLKVVPEGYTREFFVIRLHEGVAGKLPVKVNGNGTLTFETDRFSTYALAYKDTAKKPAKTSDNTNIALYATLACISLCAVAIFRRKEEQ